MVTLCTVNLQESGGVARRGGPQCFAGPRPTRTARARPHRYPPTAATVCAPRHRPYAAASRAGETPYTPYGPATLCSSRCSSLYTSSCRVLPLSRMRNVQCTVLYGCAPAGTSDRVFSGGTYYLFRAWRFPHARCTVLKMHTLARDHTNVCRTCASV